MQLEGKKWPGFQMCYEEITQKIDRAWIKSLIDIHIQALDNLSDYKHKKALEIIEKHFWLFCDNYLELVKARVYQLKEKEEGVSGQASLALSLHPFFTSICPLFALCE